MTCWMLCLEDLGEASRAGKQKIFWKLGTVLPLSVIFLGSIDERPYYLHKYRKIPKISPSKYKPLGTCNWKIALKYIVKQSKNGRFIPSYEASPIDFETQISLRR